MRGVEARAEPKSVLARGLAPSAEDIALRAHVDGVPRLVLRVPVVEVVVVVRHREDKRRTHLPVERTQFVWIPVLALPAADKFGNAALLRIAVALAKMLSLPVVGVVERPRVPVAVFRRALNAPVAEDAEARVFIPRRRLVTGERPPFRRVRLSALGGLQVRDISAARAHRHTQNIPFPHSPEVCRIGVETIRRVHKDGSLEGPHEEVQRNVEFARFRAVLDGDKPLAALATGERHAFAYLGRRQDACLVVDGRKRAYRPERRVVQVVQREVAEAEERTRIHDALRQLARPCEVDELAILEHHRRVVSVSLHEAAERKYRVVLERQHALVSGDVVLVSANRFARQLVRPEALASRGLHGAVEIDDESGVESVRERLLVPLHDLAARRRDEVDLDADRA